MNYTEQEIADFITARSQRVFAYKKETDPMMAKAFAGEIDKADWVAKKIEIKEKFPYPQGCAWAEIEEYAKDKGLI